MITQKIEQIMKRRDELNAQLKALRIKEQAQNRKNDTRRKILIGSVILKMIKSGDMQQHKLDNIMDKYLDRDQDRALFDLPSKASERSDTVTP